jgi:hypothetical protein
MRENLLGYLLNAVEPEERSAVEENLAQDARLRGELDLLRTGLAPLDGELAHHEPPKGLAQRCCEFVFSRDIMPAKLSPATRSETLQPRHRWSRLDLVVGGAIAAAVAILILPAIYHSLSEQSQGHRPGDERLQRQAQRVLPGGASGRSTERSGHVGADAGGGRISLARSGNVLSVVGRRCEFPDAAFEGPGWDDPGAI